MNAREEYLFRRPAACLVAVSGQIGSGKTTLSQRLASILQWDLVRISLVLQKLAIAERRDTSRRGLIAVGNECMATGATRFARTILRGVPQTEGSGAIIDGVRSVALYSALVASAGPLPARLVFLDVPLHERERRLREGDRVDDLTHLSDPYVLRSEATVDALADRADIVVGVADIMTETRLVISALLTREL